MKISAWESMLGIRVVRRWPDADACYASLLVTIGLSRMRRQRVLRNCTYGKLSSVKD
jgi:hypothetical protein